MRHFSIFVGFVMGWFFSPKASFFRGEFVAGYCQFLIEPHLHFKNCSSHSLFSWSWDDLWSLPPDSIEIRTPWSSSSPSSSWFSFPTNFHFYCFSFFSTNFFFKFQVSLQQGSWCPNCCCCCCYCCCCGCYYCSFCCCQCCCCFSLDKLYQLAFIFKTYQSDGRIRYLACLTVCSCVFMKVAISLTGL